MIRRMLITFIFAFASIGCDRGYRHEYGPIDREAKDQSVAFWDERFTKCGDSRFVAYTRYSTEPPEIYEMKGFFSLCSDLMQEPFTEADKLNELEWIGRTEVLCRAYRVYKKGEWSEWKNGAFLTLPSVEPLSNQMSWIIFRKAKGKWIFEARDWKIKPVPCDKVPQ